MAPPNLLQIQYSPKYIPFLLDYDYSNFRFLHIMISKILLAVSLALTLGTAAYAGAVYKWSDEGRMIYSQTPPAPGIEFEVVYQDEVGVKTSVAKADPDASNSGNSFEERREQRKQSEADKKVTQESNKIKAENCAIATKNMESLTSRGQVTVKDGDIYRKLSEDERQGKIQETQEQVSEFCS